MTATQSASLGFPQNVFSALRQLGALAIKGGIALFILFLAGIIAIATAAAGLAIAAVAIVISVFGNRSDRGADRGPSRGYGPRRRQDRADGEGITLDAHKTPRGWTVE